jgi:DNA-binding MarR family transcriptional regulator
MKSRSVIYVKMIDMADYDDQPLGFLLYQLMAALRPHVNAELRPLGIGLAEFVCMRNLSMWPDQSNAELARRANVSPQAMNLVLRALQDMDLIARPEGASSGRSLPARLTRKGVALLKRAEAAVQVADARLLDALAPADRDELKRLLYVSSSRYLKNAASA